MHAHLHRRHRGRHSYSCDPWRRHVDTCRTSHTMHTLPPSIALLPNSSLPPFSLPPVSLPTLWCQLRRQTAPQTRLVRCGGRCSNSCFTLLARVLPNRKPNFHSKITSSEDNQISRFDLASSHMRPHEILNWRKTLKSAVQSTKYAKHTLSYLK